MVDFFGTWMYGNRSVGKILTDSGFDSADVMPPLGSTKINRLGPLDLQEGVSGSAYIEARKLLV